MTGVEYMVALEQALEAGPDRGEILSDISAHFREGSAAGVSEDELCRMLGSPSDLAREYNLKSAVRRASENPTARSALSVVFAVLGMGFVSLILVLPITAAFLGVWVGVAAASFSLIVSALALFVAGIWSMFAGTMPVWLNAGPAPLSFALSLATLSLGVLVGLLTGVMGKWMIKAAVWYGGACASAARGRRKA